VGVAWAILPPKCPPKTALFGGVLRHSFISALATKGVDQRIIDDLVGRQTEEQRRRYRHLFPDVKEKAVHDVFGGAAVPPAE
jgi:site-specific recombinase XerD